MAASPTEQSWPGAAHGEQSRCL